MSQDVDFDIAPIELVEKVLCRQLSQIRLSRNINQSRLGKEAGVSRRTISRLENGEGVSLDTFIRVMRALNLTNRLEVLLPNPKIRPIERVIDGKQRLQAYTSRNHKFYGGGEMIPIEKYEEETARRKAGSSWEWGDRKREDK